MKPLNCFEQIIRMPDKAVKFDLGLRMVKRVIAYGVKPTVTSLAMCLGLDILHTCP